MDYENKVVQLEADLVVADRVNGKLIRGLREIYKLVTGPMEHDEVRDRVLLVLESDEIGVGQ